MSYRTNANDGIVFKHFYYEYETMSQNTFLLEQKYFAKGSIKNQMHTDLKLLSPHALLMVPVE